MSEELDAGAATGERACGVRGAEGPAECALVNESGTAGITVGFSAASWRSWYARASMVRSLEASADAGCFRGI